MERERTWEEDTADWEAEELSEALSWEDSVSERLDRIEERLTALDESLSRIAVKLRDFSPMPPEDPESEG